MWKEQAAGHKVVEEPDEEAQVAYLSALHESGQTTKYGGRITELGNPRALLAEWQKQAANSGRELSDIKREWCKDFANKLSLIKNETITE
jgi:hypothetical protein